MKSTLVRFAMSVTAAGAILGWSLPAFAGDDGAIMKKADDLVKQAMNAGGDPPAASDRIAMLNKAIELANLEPDHRLRGTRLEAINTIQLAIEAIKDSDPESQIYSDLDDADRKLREAIELAEGH
jgi:hypothetical protein